MFLLFIILISLSIHSAQRNLTTTGQEKIFQPPPSQQLSSHRDCVWWARNDSTINCHGATFKPSNGYFQPCNRHSHCYGAREPTDWCILGREFKWTNWGCHCDYKIGSCVIERYDLRGRQTQWAYCTPNNEFYCATRMNHKP